MDFKHKNIDSIAVSARELHKRLGIKRDFTNWFKYYCNKASLVEGTDFLLANIGEQKGRGGHNKVGYIIPVDIGKHLCMLSGVFGEQKKHRSAAKKYRGRKATNNFLPL